MSRIGKMPVAIPAGVEVTVADGNLVTVKGPKGSLTQQLYPTMTLTQEAGVVHVARPNDEKQNRALHGLTRALLHNMVVGVSEGYRNRPNAFSAHQEKRPSRHLRRSAPVFLSPPFRPASLAPQRCRPRTRAASALHPL